MTELCINESLKCSHHISRIYTKKKVDVSGHYTHGRSETLSLDCVINEYK